MPRTYVRYASDTPSARQPIDPGDGLSGVAGGSFDHDQLGHAQIGQSGNVAGRAVPKRHGDLQGALVPSRLKTTGRQSGHAAGDLVHREVEAVPAVAVFDDAIQGGIAVAPEHDWYVAVSNRLGVTAHFMEMDGFAVVRRDVVVPQGAQDLDKLPVSSGPSPKGNPEGGEFLRRPSDADPEHEPTSRHDIETGRLLGHQEGIVLGKQEDAGGEAYPGGARGREGQCHHRIEPVGVGRDGNPAVGCVRVRRDGPVHHDDVLTGPEGREPGRIGRSGHRLDHQRVCSGADAQGVESDTHTSCYWPIPEPISSRGNPRTFSATMLRCTSAVPPPTVRAGEYKKPRDHVLSPVGLPEASRGTVPDATPASDDSPPSPLSAPSNAHPPTGPVAANMPG